MTAAALCSAASARLSPVRVVVGDDRLDGALLRVLLREHGVDVAAVCATLGELLVACGRERPAVVVLDLGLHLSRSIRYSLVTEDAVALVREATGAAVLVCTGRDDRDTRESLHNVPHILKPATPEALARRIREVLP